MTVQSQSKQGNVTKVLAILGDPRPGSHVAPHEHRVGQAERIVALFESKQGEERWASCAECGDTGLMSALAPCTTFGSDCACNGPRIEVPCEFCGLGEGRA